MSTKSTKTTERFEIGYASEQLDVAPSLSRAVRCAMSHAMQRGVIIGIYDRMARRGKCERWEVSPDGSIKDTARRDKAKT
jgi:hypothetical protein